MYFSEFIEAICRVADKLCIPNIVLDEFESLEQFYTKPKNEVLQYKQKPLYEKIESFLLILGKNCLNNAFFQFKVIPMLELYIDQNSTANSIEA